MNVVIVQVRIENIERQIFELYTFIITAFNKESVYGHSIIKKLKPNVTIKQIETSIW